MAVTSEEEFRKAMGQPTLPPTAPQTAQVAPGATITPQPTPNPTFGAPVAPNGFKQVIPPNASNTLDLKQFPGRPIEGKYIGKKDTVTKIGPQVIWEFAGGQGAFGIYGFTALNRCMETLNIGQEVRITYTGMIKKQTKFGLKDAHQCTVEVKE